MTSDHESVRLVAADSLFRQQAHWAVDRLVDALNDPFLLNRQFAERGMEKLLGSEIMKSGYRFYMTPEERRDHIHTIRDAISRTSSAPSSAGTEAGDD